MTSTAVLGRKEYTGTCKWFNARRGYGFIAMDDGSENIFVHQSELYCRGFRSLKIGEKLVFNIKIMNDGRRKAINVTGPNGEYCNETCFCDTSHIDENLENDECLTDIAIKYAKNDRNELAEKHFEEAIRITNENDSYSMVNYILYLTRQNGKSNKCKYYIEKCLKISNLDKDDYRMIGNCCRCINEKILCINVFEKMLELDENYPFGVYNYGIALFYFQYYRRAIDFLKKSVTFKFNYEDSGTVSLYLGIIYYELDNNLAAKNCLLNGLKHCDHLFTKYKLFIYLCYIYSNECNEKEATQYLNKIESISKAENQTMGKLMKGYFNWKLQNDDKIAEKLFMSEVNEFSVSITSHLDVIGINFVYYLVAQFYQYSKKCKNNQKSLEFYTKLLEIKPYFALGYYYKSLLLHEMKLCEKALVCAKTAYDINKEVPKITKHYTKLKNNSDELEQKQSMDESKQSNFDIDLKSNYKKEFKLWLFNKVKQSQYLKLFEQNKYNDIRLIEHFDNDELLNLGIKTLHVKLIMKHVSEFKNLIIEFKNWLNENKLNKYNSYLESIGIITLDSFKILLDKMKNNPSKLIDELTVTKGISFKVLQRIYYILSIETNFFNENNNSINEQIEGFVDNNIL